MLNKDGNVLLLFLLLFENLIIEEFLDFSLPPAACLIPDLKWQNVGMLK